MELDFVFDWPPALAAAAGGLAVTVGLGMIGAWRIFEPKAGGLPARIVIWITVDGRRVNATVRKQRQNAKKGEKMALLTQAYVHGACRRL